VRPRLELAVVREMADVALAVTAGRRRLLLAMALPAATRPARWMVRGVGVTVGALLVARLACGELGLGLVAARAQLARGPSAELVGLMASGAGQLAGVRLGIGGRDLVAARAGHRAAGGDHGLAARMGRVAARAGALGAGVVAAHILVAAATGALRAGACGVRAVTVRARAVLRHLALRENLPVLVAIGARARDSVA